MHRVELFDDIHRADPSPRGELEDSFAFLNRVKGPYWDQVRTLIERWFAGYPADDRNGLRGAFRSKRLGQHLAAWWELYLHELFTRLGYDVEVHPELPDTRSRPDFLLRRGDSQLFVEAAIVFSGIRSSVERGAPPWMLDAITHAKDPNFMVALEAVRGRGGEQLKRREIVGPLERWLAGLDPDVEERKQGRDEAGARKTISCRGWEMTFEAIPVRPEARGWTDRGILGIHPTAAGYVDDIEQLLGTLKKKAGQSGRPRTPVVIAVQCLSSFMEPLDIEQSLFGREGVRVSVEREDERLVRTRDGFWMGPTGPRNQRVSGVLTATGLHPANVGKVAPSLWVNPWADHPAEEPWPFAQYTATEEGKVVGGDAEPDMAGLLRLPDEWPRGQPFPKRPARRATAGRPSK